MNRKKLAIVTTHPIQYYAPYFKMLRERNMIDIRVFYTWPQAINEFKDPDFNHAISWDIPLLEGYSWEAVPNISKRPGSKSWYGIVCPTLITSIQKYSADAVMVYGWNLKSHFKVMRFFKGKIPVFFFGDSTLLDEKGFVRKIARKLVLTFIYKYVDKAFYTGKANMLYFQEYGVKLENLVHSPHAIDNDRFCKDAVLGRKESEDLKTKIGFEKEDIVVLFCGKLEKKKNPEILIKVIEDLRDSHSNIKLLFVGDGILKKRLEVFQKDRSWVSILSFQNQSKMPIVYGLADIFCLPSNGPQETWGLAVNEAMACGKPVIVSDKVGAANDLVQEGVNGFIFKAGDCRGMLNKFRKLLELDLSQAGKYSSEIIKKFSYETKCKSLEHELSKLK